MQKYFKSLCKFALLSFLASTIHTYAQAIYDANGQYRGYTQTSPSGVTTLFNAQGQNIGSSQVDNGQTNYYSSRGVYQGTNTATPMLIQPNTTIDTPRQAQQAPAIRGW